MKTLKEVSGELSPNNMLNVRLDRCQKILLHAMYEMETCPSRNVGENNMVMSSDKAIICEKLPVGKSIAALALICHTVDEPVKNDRCNYSGYWFSSCTYQCTHHLVCTLEQIDMLTVPWTIIISNSAGVDNYVEMLEKLTNLKYCRVSTVADIEKIVDLLQTKDQAKINELQVVLIKHKLLKTEDNISIIKKFKQVTEGIKFKRCIIDNFNDLKLTYNDPLLSADFTWIICQQIRKSLSSMRQSVSGLLEKFIRDDYYNNPILQLCKDENLQRFFTIRFDPTFLKNHYGLPRVESFNVLIDNRHRIFKYQNVLVDSLTALINENQIAKLAEQLGIDCNSMGHLHYLLLENSNDNYIQISECLNEVVTALETSSNFSDSRQNSSLLKKLYTMLEQKKRIPAKIKAENAIAVCEKLRSDLEKKKHKLLNPLERLQENLKDYECQCCFVSFNDLDDHVFVLHCCQVLLCVDCIFVNRSRLITKCPKCSFIFRSFRNLPSSHNLSYLNFDLAQLRSLKTIDANSLKYMTTANTDPKTMTLLELLAGKELTSAKIFADENLRWVYKDVESFGSLDKKCDEQQSYLVYTSRKTLDFVSKEIEYHQKTLNNCMVQVACNPRQIKQPNEITSLIFFDNISISEKQKVINAIQTIGRTYNLVIYRLVALH
jgi:hypothetical protein